MNSHAAPKEGAKESSKTASRLEAAGPSLSAAPPAYGIGFLDGILMDGPTASAQPVHPPAIQRRCRESEDEEEQTVQTKPVPAVDAGAGLDVDAAMRAAGRDGISLPGEVRSYFEPRFGYDLSSVRAHVGGDAAEGARARAYTIGRDIVFGASEYAPTTVEGKRLLAHELTHVVQQDGGHAATPGIQRQPAPPKKTVPAKFKPRPMMLEDVVKEMTGLGGPYADLKAWTDTIKPGKFLGHPIDAGSSPIKGVRPEFQKLLDAAEVKVKDEFKKSGNPIPTGYGIRSIGGFRNEISPHGAGVAIDIDAGDNPYIMHEGEPLEAKTDPSKATELSKELRPVYHRIAEFILNDPIDGEQSIIPTLIGSEDNLPKGGRATRRERLGQYYDRLAKESEAMRKYFALMKDDAALKAYLDGDWKTTHARESPPAVDAIKKQMWDDYALLGGDIPRGGPPGISDFKMPGAAGRPFHPSGRPQKDPASGFLTIPREIVLGLGQIVPRWGAIDFGVQSGDVMHFDDRYGIGKPFEDAKAPAKAKVDAENKAATAAAEKAAQEKGGGSGSAASTPQRKAIIGSPDDPFERQADDVADRVMRMDKPAAGTQLQRKCECGGAGDCESCKKGEMLQRTATGPASSGSAPAIVHEVLRSPGQPLDVATRTFMESRFVADFSRVRVHTDERAAESARAVQARAYTVGHNVVFSANKYAPSSPSGRGLLAHELAHTLQQRNASGAPPSPEPHGIFEVSAEAAGREVVEGRRVSGELPASAVGLSRAPAPPAEIEMPAEYAFAADKRKRTWRSYARSEAQKDAARIRRSGKLSPEYRKEIDAKLAFFEGEAKEIYIREIRPALVAAEEMERREREGGRAYYESTHQAALDQRQAEEAERREREGMRAYYESTRQATLDRRDAELLDEVARLSAQQIYSEWKTRKDVFISVASSPHHRLNAQQLSEIYRLYWGDRHDLNRLNYAHITDLPLEDRLAAEERFETEENQTLAMLKTYPLVLEFLLTVENAGKHRTLEELNQDAFQLYGFHENLIAASSVAAAISGLRGSVRPPSGGARGPAGAPSRVGGWLRSKVLEYTIRGADIPEVNPGIGAGGTSGTRPVAGQVAETTTLSPAPTPDPVPRSQAPSPIASISGTVTPSAPSASSAAGTTVRTSAPATATPGGATGGSARAQIGQAIDEATAGLSQPGRKPLDPHGSRPSAQPSQTPTPAGSTLPRTIDDDATISATDNATISASRTVKPSSFHPAPTTATPVNTAFTPPGPHRVLEARDYAVKPIKAGANKGKLLLTHKTTGQKFLFKPRSGEVEIIGSNVGIVAGERYRRAPAAAYLAREAGIPTPDAEIVIWRADGKDEIGSLQEWITKGQAAQKFGSAVYKAAVRSQPKLDLDAFDYVIANMDRNAGNWKIVVDPQTNAIEEVIPIDMDASLPPGPGRYSHGQVLSPHQEELPATISRRLYDHLLQMSANRAAIEKELVTLQPSEIQGVFTRLDELLDSVRGGHIKVVP